MENTFDYVKVAVKALSNHLGNNIDVLDISKLTPVTDYFIITDGASTTQMEALADACEEAVVKAGHAPARTEGTRSESWILLDFTDFIVHIFSDKSRQFYDLGRLWSDAAKVKIEE